MQIQKPPFINLLILRTSSCLLFILIPIAIFLACGLIFQVADLLADEPVDVSAQRLTGFGADDLINNPVGEPISSTSQPVPIANRLNPTDRGNASSTAPHPIPYNRSTPTPTPQMLSRLIAAAANLFGEATPTPRLNLKLAALPDPTLPPPPPTYTATPSPLPTATPSPMLSPSSTPTPLATAEAQVSAATTVNVRAGPGTDYPVIGALVPNTLMPVTGRNQDSSWWQVQQANGQTGWVAGWVVEAKNAGGVAVVSVSPPPQPTSALPLPTDTLVPTPVPILEYDFMLAEFYNSPTANSFLTIYVAVVDPKEIPIGDMKIVGVRLDHNLSYESPLSTWHYEGYSAPGEVIKSGNVKFEPPGGIETTSWIVHLEDAYGNRQSDDVPFDVDVSDKQWYFIKFRRKF